VDAQHYLDPARKDRAGYEIALQMMWEGLIPEGSFWGTISCHGIGPNGAMAGMTSTSGTAWKIPGRAGDSPVIGAGSGMFDNGRRVRRLRPVAAKPISTL